MCALIDLTLVLCLSVPEDEVLIVGPYALKVLGSTKPENTVIVMFEMSLLDMDYLSNFNLEEPTVFPFLFCASSFWPHTYHPEILSTLFI